MLLVHEAPRVRVADGHAAIHISDRDARESVEREAFEAAHGDANVLITGDRAVGTIAVARFIHERSHRSAHSFGVVNCNRVPDLLVESDLFGGAGHAGRGYQDNQGLLTSLYGGTLFLDQIDALSGRLQVQLLRTIETSETVRFGVDGVQLRLPVRLIASTTTNLFARVAAGLFLEDLYRRLHGVTVWMPRSA